MHLSVRGLPLVRIIDQILLANQLPLSPAIVHGVQAGVQA